MNSIDNKHEELKKIDSAARRESLLTRLNPAIKLLCAMVYLLVMASYDRFDLPGVIVGSLPIFMLVLLYEDNLALCFKRLCYALPFVLLMGLLNPFFDRNVLFIIGGLQITTGMISGITMIIKGISSLLCAYLLITTTTLDNLCNALSSLHFPAVLTDIIQLMYRYSFVLIEEASQLWDAYSLRSFERGISIEYWGSFLGSLLLRTYDRSQEIYESMLLRGYDGSFGEKKIPVHFMDVAVFSLFSGVLVLIRILL